MHMFFLYLFEFQSLCSSASWVYRQLAGPNFCNDGHQHLLCCCPYSWSLDFTSSDGTVWWHAYRPDLLAFVRTCWVVESDLEKVYILSFSDGENSYRYFMEKSVHFFQKIAKIGTTELAKFFHSLSETELTRHCQKVWLKFGQTKSSGNHYISLQSLQNQSVNQSITTI